MVIDCNFETKCALQPFLGVANVCVDGRRRFRTFLCLAAGVDELLDEALGLANRKRTIGDPLRCPFHFPGFLKREEGACVAKRELAGFDAVFAPGGHGPMVDLADNPDVGRLLLALHRKHAPIAALCHGPAMLLSAPERAGGQWLFDGYRLTSFTDEEEDQTEAGLLGLAWLVDVALKNAGAVFDDGPAAWISHVVVDRNLITGQNPGSTEATADAVIKKLLAPARQAA